MLPQTFTDGFAKFPGTVLIRICSSRILSFFSEPSALLEGLGQLRLQNCCFGVPLHLSSHASSVTQWEGSHSESLKKLGNTSAKQENAVLKQMPRLLSLRCFQSSYI